jgi:uncharacterized protein (DUF302 family)
MLNKCLQDQNLAQYPGSHANFTPSGGSPMHEGIQTVASNYSVDETVARLQTLLQEKGVKLFCLIDHSGEAAGAGLTMRPAKLLIFGSPKAGTPLMVAAPSTALDLPLKILVAETETGKTLLFWNDPEWLQQRHGFPVALAANLAAGQALAYAAAE